jgi:hypothetical protein
VRRFAQSSTGPGAAMCAVGADPVELGPVGSAYPSRLSVNTGMLAFQPSANFDRWGADGDYQRGGSSPFDL